MILKDDVRGLKVSHSLTVKPGRALPAAVGVGEGIEQLSGDETASFYASCHAGKFSDSGVITYKELLWKFLT
ncbi:hypothetical protein E4U17_002381 [Claviceps sp. LM77 group G4]|nr:hypothetical protein E4U17_002381 [Claviceps sp. LM77 group G4]